MTPRPIDGINEDRITAWLVAQEAGIDPPVTYTRVVGGRSNLTVRVSPASGPELVLRRPPVVGVIASAHDVAREHRILTGLLSTAVPVPRPVALCEDLTVTGSPFYVMEYVPGRIVRTAAEAAALDPGERRAVSDSLIDTLAVLHQLDATHGQLARVGRPDGYVTRQLHRLHDQVRRRGTPAAALAGEVHDRLASRIPPAQHLSIVHGDYRLDNVVLGPDAQISAVLDWELCTRGDPLADLGLLLVYWLDPGDAVIPTLSSPTDLPGFSRGTDIAGRYAALTGLDISDLPFYVAFGMWKLAIILEGVYARYCSGAYDDEQGGYQQLGEAVPDLLERAAVHLT